MWRDARLCVCLWWSEAGRVVSPPADCHDSYSLAGDVLQHISALKADLSDKFMSASLYLVSAFLEQQKTETVSISVIVILVKTELTVNTRLWPWWKSEDKSDHCCCCNKRMISYCKTSLKLSLSWIRYKYDNDWVQVVSISCLFLCLLLSYTFVSDW